jgi:glycosyltransferase involved in cell wall biosynthesis
MITCWYHNISMANYSENLINALKRRDVSVKVVTSHCKCKYKYRDSSSFFEGQYSLVTTPFDSYCDEPRRSKIRTLFYRTSRIPLGLSYAKQCGGSDILHYQQSSSYSFGELPLLTLFTRKNVSKKVVTIHNLNYYGSYNPLRLLHRVYQYADAIIVHSELQKSRLMQHYRIPEDKIHVIFLGGQEVNLRGLERTRVTFFGSPVKPKGFFVLLNALRLLRDQGIRINLEVYGIYADEEEQEAKKEARQNNVEDQVKWCGRLTEQEFDEKMQESLFTFAIYTDAVWGSQIITRSMMNGTPVIATTLGGSSEYLGETGTYVPPNDSTALAFAIRSLMENREQREDLGKMARHRALQYLSWDAIAEKTVRIYQSLIEKQK